MTAGSGRHRLTVVISARPFVKSAEQVVGILVLEQYAAAAVLIVEQHWHSD